MPTYIVILYRIQMTSAKITTRWTLEKNQKLIKRYKELNLIPFSFTLSEEVNDMVPKKVLKTPAHSQITKFEEHYITTANAVALKMGMTIIIT